MMGWTWIRAAEDAPLMIVLSAVALYVLLILYNRLVDNAPLLLMDGPEVLSDNLRRAKLREADVPAIDDALLADVQEGPK